MDGNLVNLKWARQTTYVTDHVTNLVRLYQPSDKQADAYMGLTVRVAKQVRDQSFVVECGTIRGAKPYTEHGGSGQHVYVSLLDEQGKSLTNEIEPQRPR